jgi:hypothetical protein
MTEIAPAFKRNKSGKSWRLYIGGKYHCTVYTEQQAIDHARVEAKLRNLLAEIQARIADGSAGTRA